MSDSFTTTNPDPNINAGSNDPNGNASSGNADTVRGGAVPTDRGAESRVLEWMRSVPVPHGDTFSNITTRTDPDTGSTVRHSCYAFTDDDGGSDRDAPAGSHTARTDTDSGERRG